MDTDISEIAFKSMKYICEKSKQIHSNPRGLFYHHTLSGSLREGAFTPRLFIENQLFPHRINRVVEADFEFHLNSFSPSNKHCFRDTHPGFVEINVLGCRWDVDNHTFEEFLKAVDNNGLLQTYRFKQQLANRNDDSRTNYTIAPKIVFSLLTEVPIEQIDINTLHEKVEKASIAIGFNIEIDREIQLEYSMDLTFIFRLAWTPKIVREWVKRPRSWPPTSALKDVLNEGYVISKPSSMEKHNIETTEFRYSFAHIERRIIALQSPTQRLVYLIFKSLLYRWIIPVDRNVTSSYIAKSTMLWTCQEYPPTHKLWDDDNLSIKYAVKVLFRRLSASFKLGKLSYYFVPSINIIENYHITTKHNIVLRIETILGDFQSAIPDNLMEINALLRTLHATKTKVLNFLYLFSDLEATMLWVVAHPGIMKELGKRVNRFYDFLYDILNVRI